MTRYLIKCTYLTGQYKGKSYLLRKGGYVTEEKDYQREDTTYKSRKIAERVCKNLSEKNKRAYDDERIMNDSRIKRGFEKKKFFYYELESYEPFPTEIQPNQPPGGIAPGESEENIKNVVEIKRLKSSANVAKDRLISIASELEEYGAIRDSKSLFAIIGKLEYWQNKQLTPK